MSIFSRAFNSLTNVLSSGVRMAASPRLLGRYSGGAGAAQEIQLGAGFLMVGDTLTFTSGATAWGAITGTLSAQADLLAALNAKAASSHTHVSADITDASSGGNSAADASKVAVFGTIGDLKSSFAFTLFGSAGSARIEEMTGFVSNYLVKIPNKNGGIAVVPTYLDSTAANAAVSVGDVWWDLTLNKARVRLS